MKLTHDELEFLSAWAREEWEPACYQLPAHRLQVAHRVPGAQMIEFIKVWTEREGKKDQDILGVAANPQPKWPWSSAEQLSARIAEACRSRARVAEAAEVESAWGVEAEARLAAYEQGKLDAIPAEEVHRSLPPQRSGEDN